jgi:N-sulfoglucosamine sulfohydrolase
MPNQPNILLITADDMNWDAVGAYGCPVAGTTPTIDRLAAEGMRFDHAHVTIAVCQPSRSAIMTGRYPHRSGGEGFHHLRTPGVPILPELLRGSGYRVGILGKVPHSTPYSDFQWDMTWGMDDLGHGRNPAIYRQYASAFIDQAKAAARPFFLMLNSHDPHRPFYGNDKPEWYEEGDLPTAAIPSRTFAPDEITTPGCLPDLPDVRHEISEYYSSVRRCDDTVSAALEVLREAGCEENTLVVFLSDNGMAFPFAKTNCYLNSTRTPWIMRWSGTIQPGSGDTKHFISGIDLMPTLLDAAGIAPPAGVDGRSFLPLLRGERQSGRDFVFTQFHQTAGRRNYPMRCVQSRHFGYIFNPWSDGERVFKNESQAGRTMRAMQAAAEDDPAIAERVELFLHRVPEELYDFRNDPDALRNLIDDPRYAAELHSLQAELERWMETVDDPALAAFCDRGSPTSLNRFVQQTAEALGGE